MKKDIRIPLIILGTLASSFIGSGFANATTPNPIMCPDNYAPVCAQPPMPVCPEGVGCIQAFPPQKTYGNQCEAKLAGATMIMSGECKTSVITSFTASPTTITAGQSSTLSWASNGDKCIVKESGRPAIGTMIVSPIVTTSYDLTCYKGNVASVGKIVTITVTGTTSSGTISGNPYGSNLSSAAKNTINTWITKNIKSRSTTLSSADYTKFIETIIARLDQIKAGTPTSNVNKINVINYLVWELQDIVNNIFFEGLFG